jgi:hypothetical protein
MWKVIVAFSPPASWDFPPMEWVLIILIGLMIFGRRIVKFRKGQHHD